MPRFSANLGFMWPDRPFPEQLRAAAAAGFTAIETHWPYDTPADEARAICAATKLTFLGVNTVPGAPGESGLGAVAGREDDFQAAVDQAVAYCQAAGASAIHTMAGAAPYDETGRTTLVNNLRIAADKVAGRGIALYLEGLNQRDNPGYFYSTCEQVADIMERVGRDEIRMMFDVYHVAISQGDVLTRLNTFLPLIGHVQIAGVPGRHEPDEGEIDYRAVLQAVDESGYAGWVGCEYRPRAGTDEGLAWVSDLGFSLEPASG